MATHPRYCFTSLPLYIPLSLCYHQCMSTSSPTVIEVAVAVHLDKTFHYRVPPHLADRALPGHRVFVPFGHRRLTGYILGNVAEASENKLKDIIDVLDPDPLWTDNELEFFRWIAAYYLYPLGEVLKTALPTGINLQSSKGTAGTDNKINGGKSIKRERFYRPVITAEAERQPGSKALEILEVIRETGDMPAADLRRRFGHCSPQLKRLEELGLVQM